MIPNTTPPADRPESEADTVAEPGPLPQILVLIAAAKGRGDRQVDDPLGRIRGTYAPEQIRDAIAELRCREYYCIEHRSLFRPWRHWLISW